MAGTGQAGHCAVALTADPRWIVSIDQNWRGVRSAQVVPHTYHGVMGWFTPRP
jgi:hypothetical protein